MPVPLEAAQAMHEICDEKKASRRRTTLGECVENEEALFLKLGSGSIAPTPVTKPVTFASVPELVGEVEWSCHKVNSSEEKMVCHEGGFRNTLWEALTNDGQIVNI